MTRSSKHFILINILIICATFSNCERLEDVLVDLKSDLDAVGSQSQNCLYLVKSTDGFCKTIRDSPNSGFWSSCGANYCETTINVGKLGNYGAVPTHFRVGSFVRGISGILRPQYRITPTSPITNLSPSIGHSDDWTTSEPYDLSQIDGFNLDSQIILRVSSNPIGTDVAVIDSIIFSFPAAVPSTTDPSTETTHILPSTQTVSTVSTEIPGTSTVISEPSSAPPETSSVITETSSAITETSSAISETSSVTDISSPIPSTVTFETSPEVSQTSPEMESSSFTPPITSEPSPATESSSASTITVETSSAVSETSSEIPQTSETTERPSISTETTERLPTSTETSPVSTETTETPAISTETTETPSVSTVTTETPSVSTVTTETPSVSTETSSEMSTETTETPKISTETTETPSESTKTSSEAPETSTVTFETSSPVSESSSEISPSSSVTDTSTGVSETSSPTPIVSTISTESTLSTEESSSTPSTVTFESSPVSSELPSSIPSTSTDFSESSITTEMPTVTFESSSAISETSTSLPETSTDPIQTSTELPGTSTSATSETSTELYESSTIPSETSTLAEPSSPETSTSVEESSSTETSTELPAPSTESDSTSSTSLPETSTLTSDPSSLPTETSTVEFETSTISDTSSVITDSSESTTLITESSPVTFETSTEGVCSSEIYCTATDRFNRDWSACAGRLATKECPNNLNRVATWFCQLNGQFQGNTPDYALCSHDWIPETEKEIADGQPISPEKAQEFLNTIGTNVKSNSYFGHEIPNILNLVDGILSLVFNDVNINRFEGLVDNGWTIFGNILINNEPWQEINEEMRSRTGTEFIAKLDTTSLGLSGRVLQNSTFQDDGSNYRKDFQNFDEFRVLAGSRAEAGNPITFPENYSEQDSHIDIPSNWANYLESENITFVGVLLKPSYSNFMFPGHLNNVISGNVSSPGKIINGNIMGFSFGDLNVPQQFENHIDSSGRFFERKTRGINFIGEGVKITFQHDRPAWGDEIADVRRRLHDGETPKAVTGTSACVYWDTDNLIWSSTGCTSVVSEEGQTICECNHLTAFALLMDVHNYIGKDVGLELLTLILCPISIICLAICIYIFTSIKSERSLRNGLTRNLCICLLVGNLLMIFFMDKHYFHLSDGVCVASAVVTHYAFLCAIFWMALEGALIFKVLFLDVFGQSRDYLLTQHILAYGLPALIVGATGVTTAVRGDHGYGNDSFCWLNGSYVWAFLGPTAFILTLNLVILVLSVRKALEMKNTPQPGLSAKGESSVTWLKGCVSLSILLGLTWIFGYLMAVDHSTTANIAAYIFTILNASQGIFLFIFHGVLNSKVRAALNRRLPERFRSGSGTKTLASHYATNYTDLTIGSRVRQSFSSLKNTLLRRHSHHSSSSSRS